ncbi:16S rRNA (guanine(527)-N(7))-methyltransferase RsmG [Myceligenerans pegani]|uniref:Ribosomal RNA small subunit methyltransferase G n=1 Tax=Myceligenerans pegani TaxID=2776917 RepID=A0ABR9N1I7_9MICO|nr:16S rRNA (guanine(527)-N(7))-methyltransferase RsmG [Myceligenerans sp. TRM 65318]MBE1877516.1 16S rRNA (guanine(527)-N(7))-methyltransferase RsmG [Myceligenerans sp. TRM 65318]MBE3019787.1 16S rRNA (guanine(527)-N(7))-methyltransferase RsmG [Myceligenerans sp. TRM 65318]
MDDRVLDAETLGSSDAVREYFGEGYELVREYARMLMDEGELRGLIGPREVPRLWERHILNSAAVVPHLSGARSVADVGSGAGLPGVVVAIMRPDAEIFLVEPMERRTAWLTEVVEALALSNVEVKRGRAEEYHGAFEVDAVTSRAVGALSKLVRVSMPLLHVGGELVLLKGRNVRDEFDGARKVLRKFGAGEPDVLPGETVDGVEATTVVRVQRRK